MCKWMKRTLTLTLTLALCIGLAPASTVAASPDAPSATWNISLNASASVTASLYQIGDTPTAYRLDVSGTGATANYLGQAQPWSTYNSTITEVAVGEGIVYLGTGLFANMTALQTVTIAEGVGEIATQAFKGCSALTSVTLPQSLGVIRSYAFYECTALPEITIPAGVAQIENKAFGNCYALTKITFEQPTESNLSLTTGAFYTQYAVDTTVTTEHQAPQDYNWAGDNRTVSFGGSSEGPVVPPEGIPCSLPFGVNAKIWDVGGWYLACDRLSFKNELSAKWYRSEDLINWSLVVDYSDHWSVGITTPTIIGDGSCVVDFIGDYDDPYSNPIRITSAGATTPLNPGFDYNLTYFNHQYIVPDVDNWGDYTGVCYAVDDFTRAVGIWNNKIDPDSSDTIFCQISLDDQWKINQIIPQDDIAFLIKYLYDPAFLGDVVDSMVSIRTSTSDWVDTNFIITGSNYSNPSVTVTHTNNNYYLAYPGSLQTAPFITTYYYSSDLTSWQQNTLLSPYFFLNYGETAQGTSTNYLYGLDFSYVVSEGSLNGFELKELIKIDGNSVTSLWTLPEGTLGHFVNSGDPYIIIRNGDGTGLLYKCSDFTS